MGMRRTPSARRPVSEVSRSSAAFRVVALAATAFFTTKFNQAKTRVPDPLVP